MDAYERQSHSVFECKYPVVFMPKSLRKSLCGTLRPHLEKVFPQLAQEKSRVAEGHLMPVHVDMLLSIPPKYAVSQVVGHMNGKSAIHLARTYAERKWNLVGQHFWCSGYFVSTVGRDEDGIWQCIHNQEKEDLRLEQWEMWK